MVDVTSACVLPERLFPPTAVKGVTNQKQNSLFVKGEANPDCFTLLLLVWYDNPRAPFFDSFGILHRDIWYNFVGFEVSQ
jgi:hypothetical protein